MSHPGLDLTLGLFILNAKTDMTEDFFFFVLMQQLVFFVMKYARTGSVDIKAWKVSPVYF